jgi:acyl-CoA synthetase (AMP-forming)/AMP-acid ligase II
LLEPISTKIADEAGTKDFVVIESHEGKGRWIGMKNWSETLNTYTADVREILDNDPDIMPEDNATVIFTSGTSVRVSYLIYRLPYFPPSTERVYQKECLVLNVCF